MKRLKALAVSIVLSLIISFTFLNFYIYSVISNSKFVIV